jgi:ABC-type multidrug transport system fused ATPase/permease subunit
MMRIPKIAKRDSTYFQCFQLFSRSDLKKILLVVILQILLGLFDLIGVALIGIIGTLAVSGIQSSAPNPRILNILELINIETLSFQNQTAILGVAAAILLVGRTIATMYITKRVLFFIARRSAVVSRNHMENLLNQNLVLIQKFTVQQHVYAATAGINSITIGVVGATVTLISDLSLLFVLLIGLFVFDPWISLFSILLFGSIGYLLFRYMRIKIQIVGGVEANVSVKSSEKIVEVLTSYREAFVRNRIPSYVETIGSLRMQLSNATAEMSFMPNISKYGIESGLILGGLAMSAFQFMRYDASHAFSTLAVFLAAGSRISPAVLRAQQGIVGIKGSLAAAENSLEIMRTFSNENSIRMVPYALAVEKNDTTFKPIVEIKSLSFEYPGNSDFNLTNINLTIVEGTTVALVGGSGAGKTTLVDLIIGIHKPRSGQILVSGLPPEQAIQKWPGAIAYVPQDVGIFPGSVIQNIVLGYDSQDTDNESVTKAIISSQIEAMVEGLPNGLNENLGDRGSRLSGGQRQRLGIARALYTNPDLLILDEATSALDGKTEFDVSKSILMHNQSATKIIVAHRLSTVINADSVVYLSEGTIIAQGTFEEVRRLVPDFDLQANLMGLL